jgi:hypothetical protein
MQVAGTTQSWSVTPGSIATITQSGLFRATMFGEVAVTATLDAAQAPVQALFALPALLNNLSQVNIAANEGDFPYGWVLTIPPPPSRVVVTLRGGIGDADLYIIRPTQTGELEANIECRSENELNSTETCDLVNLAAGYWVVLVQAYTNYTGVELKAVFTTPGIPAAEVVTGSTLDLPRLTPIPVGKISRRK